MKVVRSDCDGVSSIRHNCLAASRHTISTTINHTQNIELRAGSPEGARCSNYPVGLRFEHLRRFVAAVMIDFGAVGDCMVVASRPAAALGETCNWNVAYVQQRENDIDICE